MDHDGLEKFIENYLGADFKIPIEDSAKRREVLLKIEILCHVWWDGLNYSKLSKTTDRRIPKKLIESLSTACYNCMEFTIASTWFGGFCSTPKPSLSWTAESSICLWSSLLMLAGAGALSDTVLKRILGKLKEDFESVDRFVEALIESDERLLCLLLALLELYRRKQYERSEFWDPMTLLLAMLIKLDFSESIFIDWLSSDPCSVSFIFRYFDELAKNPESVITAIQCLTSINFEQKVTIATDVNCGGSIDTRVNITEIHGNTSVEKEMVLDKKKQIVSTSKQVTMPYDEMVDSLNGLVNRLHGRLLSCNRHGTLPMNVKGLIKVISKAQHLEFRSLTSMF